MSPASLPPASSHPPNPSSPGLPPHPPASDSSDAELITGSRVDPERFSPIFDRHAVAVHGFLARRAGQDTADDLLSEVFTVAFDRRRRYDQARGDARAWLYGIALNVLRTRWRSESRRLGLLHRIPAERPAQPWDDVDRRLDAEHPGRAAADALRRLPPGERAVIQLVAWEDLPLTEVAQVLGIPEGTARSRLHRARASLRADLEPDRPGPSAPRSPASPSPFPHSLPGVRS